VFLSLKRQGRAAEVLEINLFGAAVGGILENCYGRRTPILGVLAIALDLMSAIPILLSKTDIASPRWSPAS
jgi:hypothetical protein